MVGPGLAWIRDTEAMGTAPGVITAQRFLELRRTGMGSTGRVASGRGLLDGDRGVAADDWAAGAIQRFLRRPLALAAADNDAWYARVALVWGVPTFRAAGDLNRYELDFFE